MADPLRDALTKIASVNDEWGPFPENNEEWRGMVVVTARRALIDNPLGDEVVRAYLQGRNDERNGVAMPQ